MTSLLPVLLAAFGQDDTRRVSAKTSRKKPQNSQIISALMAQNPWLYEPFIKQAQQIEAVKSRSKTRTLTPAEIEKKVTEIAPWSAIQGPFGKPLQSRSPEINPVSLTGAYMLENMLSPWGWGERFADTYRVGGEPPASPPQFTVQNDPATTGGIPQDFNPFALGGQTGGGGAMGAYPTPQLAAAPDYSQELAQLQQLAQARELPPQVQQPTYAPPEQLDPAIYQQLISALQGAGPVQPKFEEMKSDRWKNALSALAAGAANAPDGWGSVLAGMGAAFGGSVGQANQAIREQELAYQQALRDHALRVAQGTYDVETAKTADQQKMADFFNKVAEQQYLAQTGARSEEIEELNRQEGWGGKLATLGMGLKEQEAAFRQGQLDKLFAGKVGEREEKQRSRQLDIMEQNNLVDLQTRMAAAMAKGGGMNLGPWAGLKEMGEVPVVGPEMMAQQGIELARQSKNPSLGIRFVAAAAAENPYVAMDPDKAGTEIKNVSDAVIAQGYKMGSKEFTEAFKRLLTDRLYQTLISDSSAWDYMRARGFLPSIYFEQTFPRSK